MLRLSISLRVFFLLLFCFPTVHADDSLYGETSSPAEWKTPALFTFIGEIISSGKPVDTRPDILKYESAPEEM